MNRIWTCDLRIDVPGSTNWADEPYIGGLPILSISFSYKKRFWQNRETTNIGQVRLEASWKFNTESQRLYV